MSASWSPTSGSWSPDLLAAVVASAVGAGITGGLREILMTAGVPRHWAERYEAGVRQGGILVSVFARSERDVGLLHLVLDDPHRPRCPREAHRPRVRHVV